MNRRTLLIVAALALTGAFGAGVWLLLNPANPLTRIFQAKISDTDAHVIVGPYPSADDLKSLKEDQVKLVVSLLDSRLPYEKILLQRESDLANELGLRFTNFPMSSVLGQRFGDDYSKNAERAATTIAAESSKVYLHCYLGIHRAKVVQDLIAGKNISAAKYTLRESERTESARLLDQAEEQFRTGKYTDTIETLNKVSRTTVAGQILYGWAYYKSGDAASAKSHFQEASQWEPDNSEVRIGLGFCALKEGDLKSAEDDLAKVPPANQTGEYLLAKGILKYRQGKLQEAKPLLMDYQKAEPSNTEVRDILNSISQSLGK